MQILGKHSRRLKDLRRRIRCRQEGEVIVDGAKMVDDLVRWGVPVHELYLTKRWENRTDWLGISAATFLVDEEVLAQVAPTRSPQGVVAAAAEPRWPEWSADGVTLYLDGIQDPGNVGAIVRSAAGLGAAAVLLGPGSADPFGATAVRGSAGTVFRFPVLRQVDLEKAAAAIRKHGGEVWAAAAGGEPVTSWRPKRPVLLLLGAEGQGLSERARAACSGTVTIGLHNQVESLNVAVAASLLLAKAVETSS
jgi:TrmH family RNA methyltransferase